MTMQKHTTPIRLGNNSRNTSTSLVTLEGSKPMVTSLMVAEKFGKLHKNVVRDIRRMECSEQFSRLNFEPSDYVDERGKEQPMFVMTRDGFSILAMGFTGKEAMTWKEKFIAEFNRLEKIVQKVQQYSLLPDWTEARQLGKAVRRELTDAIQDVLIPYAKSNGSTNFGRFYVHYSNMLIKAMFDIEEQPNKSLRDNLNQKQLETVRFAESRMVDIITKCVEEEMPYRDIYQFCKGWANEQFVPAMGGKTKIVSTAIIAA